MLYREYCETVHDRTGNMLPESALLRLPGFCSVFSFGDLDSLEIINNKSSRGFKNYRVSARNLVIDLDDGEESIHELLKLLRELDYSYTAYVSGGKGYHIFIKCEESYRIDLPALHQVMAVNLAPTCDRSLYRHSSLIRLPGTVHEKTGKIKEVIERHLGSNLLMLPELAIAPPREIVKSSRTAVYMYYQTLADAVQYSIATGGRHNKLWQIAKDGFEAGIPYNQVLSDMQVANAFFSPPKELYEVEHVLETTYRFS